MDLIALKDEIMRNNLSNFYVFTGTEIGIQNIYLNQMSKVLKLPIVRADSVMSIYGKCTSRSLFGNSVNIYAIRDDKEFEKAEKYWDSITEDIGKNVIVLLYEKLDSRLKFAKHFKDKTVQFDKLADNVLKSYIERAGLSSKLSSKLSSNVAGSYDLAMLEVDKVKHFAQFNCIPLDEAYRLLYSDGVMCHNEDADVFQFTDAVMRRDVRTAYEVLDALERGGVANVLILGTLYNSMKATMLIQCCEDKDVGNVTGLDNGQIYYNRKYVDIYKIQELVSGVKMIAKVVDGIKSGKIDDKISVRYLMVKIMFPLKYHIIAAD